MSPITIFFKNRFRSTNNELASAIQVSDRRFLNLAALTHGLVSELQIIPVRNSWFINSLESLTRFSHHGLILFSQDCTKHVFDIKLSGPYRSQKPCDGLEPSHQKIIGSLDVPLKVIGYPGYPRFQLLKGSIKGQTLTI